MKTYFSAFLLCIGIFAHAETYYVTVVGDAANSGLTESDPWTLEHAFNTAVAGDIVHVKAGDYGALNIVAAHHGTATLPIQYIGYKNAPNDINSNMGSTMSYGDALDPLEMPLLIGSTEENAEFLGTGIWVGKNYVHVSNFQITKYKNGFLSTGEGCFVKNIIVHQVGDFNPEHTYVPGGDVSAFLNYSGKGILTYGNNVSVHDCLVVNAGAEGFTFSNSDFVDHAYNAVYSDTEINPCDYYYLLANGSSNNTLNHIFVERVGPLVHYGHGLVYKVDAQDNVANNCTVIGTKIELQYVEVKNNTFTNCHITPGSDGKGEIRIANAAHHNTFINCSVDAAQGVTFSDTSEDPNENSGHDNNFINCSFSNMNSAINWHWYSTSYDESPAFDNTFINCVFYNLDYLFMVDRVNYGNTMVNCIIQDVTEERYAHYPSIHSDVVLDFDYGNSNLYNSFVPADGAANTTAHDPMFLDADAGDFRLDINSPLVDLGETTAHDYDMNGIARPQGAGFDYGLHETGISDLSNTVTILPTNISGVSTISMVIDVQELNNANTDGVVSVIFAKDDRFSLVWDNTLSVIGPFSVDNNAWTYDNTNSSFHIFNSAAPIQQSSVLSLGFFATYDPQSTSGITNITSTILLGSGGEINGANNSDAESIIFSSF